MRCSSHVRFWTGLLLASALCVPALADRGIVALQTDFGLKDHAVAAMRGVARLVDADLVVDDLTHEIPPFDVWQAAYRLHAVAEYWPDNTVFVSVVDPGVGSERESVVAKLASGQLLVTPNNGTLTLLHENDGIVSVRRIDESRYRLPGSSESHTFHGRDLYVHVGALLASGQLDLEALDVEVDAVLLDYRKARIEAGVGHGGIPVLDPQFGNVWSDISTADLPLEAGVLYTVYISAPDGTTRFEAPVRFARTFAEVTRGAPVLYVNSIGNIALALNQANFADTFNVSSGRGWTFRVARTELPETP